MSAKPATTGSGDGDVFEKYCPVCGNTMEHEKTVRKLTPHPHFEELYKCRSCDFKKLFLP